MKNTNVFRLKVHYINHKKSNTFPTTATFKNMQKISDVVSFCNSNLSNIKRATWGDNIIVDDKQFTKDWLEEKL